MFRKLFGQKRFRIWLIVSVTLVAVMVTVLVLSNVFYDILKIALGREIRVYADSQYTAIYEPDSVSKSDALRRANELTEEVCEEGFVLLKNDNGALPLNRGASVSVFGKNSVNLVYSGSGSGGTNTSSAATIHDSLRDAGFRVNDVLESFYKNSSRSGPARDGNPAIEDGVEVLSTAETPQSYYGAEITESYANFNDAAIIVLSRIGGEGFDLPRISADDPSRHYLELDPNEIDLVKSVTSAGFGKVIVVVNSLSVMELGWAESGEYGHIDSVIYVGGPGNAGISALGRILNGEVNPSGHTVDTWATDLLAAPAAINFGNNGSADGNVYTVDGENVFYNFVDYEEGIYVGYRYYETRGLGDSEWYNQNVVYPFGYGLSYTTFSQRITSTNILPEADWTAQTQNIEITVAVRNTGDVPGKDVIQVYAHAPYYEGGIEKSEVVLVGFVKTDELRAGETREYTISFDVYDFASYDYNDANGNKFYGYELDPGDYVFSIRSDVHSVIDSVSTNLDEGVKFENDSVTGYKVENRFDDADDQLSTVLSRNDWEDTMPQRRSDEERATDKAFINLLDDRTTNNPNTYDKMPLTGQPTELDMFKLIYMEDYEGYDDERWNEILDALTVSEMAGLYNHGAFQTADILRIGKVLTIDADGPYGFTNFIGDTATIFGTCSYASEVVLASTWNVDLAFRMGECVGDEGLWGTDENGGTPYSGWYAPGANIHRTAFGGRNGEYFSEDPFISGAMAASEIKGAASKGVYCYIKHFAVNEQETSRSGLCTWLTEQALREIYLKPFETAVKEGEATAIMSSFNRIGTKWTGGDYRLITEVLRNEWGFKGMVICDFNTETSPYMNPEQMIYAGGDLNLTTTEYWTNFNENDAGDVAMLRRAAKNVLYTVSCSNAMNAQVAYYLPPLWVWLLSGAGVLILAGLIVWGVFVIRRVLKQIKDGQAKD